MLRLIPAVLVLFFGGTVGLPSQSIDPRAPGAIQLPVFGRTEGSLHCVTAMSESFGRHIYSVGDVNGDQLNDWVLTHRRCDTSMRGRAVVELLLFRGVLGGLPDATGGERLGPSEINADCSFVGAGDYDGDGYRDIVVSQRIVDDSSAARAPLSSIVVFWNDMSGHFSVADTTHLTSPSQRIAIMTQVDHERVAQVPLTVDIDKDGAEDLVVLTDGVQYIAGVQSSCPPILVYRGNNGHRWGRRGTPTEASWQFWQRLFTRRVSVLDHDGDGALDIAMHVENSTVGARGNVSVIYGTLGEMPDTTQLEHIDYIRANGLDGKQCEFIDVTGDNVPELILSNASPANGLVHEWLVYVGLRGQRLRSQYGSGADPPRPGDTIWWSKPWTVVQSPNTLNGAWSPPFNAVLDVGDIGLDGVGDFCATSYPDVICYNGGRRMDAGIDAWMPTWPADATHGRMITRLGDIDGSKIPAIAVPFDGGGVTFYKADARIPRGGTLLRLPDGSDKPSSSLMAVTHDDSLFVSIAPNPSQAVANISWESADNAFPSVTLHDSKGRDLSHWLLAPGTTYLSVDVKGVPPGTYFITVRVGDASRTAVLNCIR